MREFIVNKNDSDQRLDKFVIKTVKKLPLTLMYKYLRTKRIKVNGRRAEGEQRLCEGDRVEMYINDEFFSPASDETDAFKRITPRLSIAYEDKNILVADKPKGMLVHSDEGEDYNTLINHIKAYLYKNGGFQPDNENSFTPALCNRIDRNTSGLVIAAKNAEALRILNEKIKLREIKKYYLCIVHGRFEEKEGVLRGYIRKDEKLKQSSVYSSFVPGAKNTVTAYRVLKAKNGLSLLEIELETGRTHQIRAQMAAAGHPLLGDLKYGTAEDNRGYLEKSQALCAYRLVFSFKTPAGSLEYLNKKVISARPDNIFEEF